MAANSTKTKTTTTPDFEAANERILDAGRKVSTAYLDGVENYLSGIVDFERKVAKQSQVDALASLLGAQADLTEKISKVSVSAARELIAS